MQQEGYEEEANTQNGGDDEEPVADPHGKRQGNTRVNNEFNIPIDTMSGGDVGGAAAAADSYRDETFD